MICTHKGVKTEKLQFSWRVTKFGSRIPTIVHTERYPDANCTKYLYCNFLQPGHRTHRRHPARTRVPGINTGYPGTQVQPSTDFTRVAPMATNRSQSLHIQVVIWRRKDDDHTTFRQVSGTQASGPCPTTTDARSTRVPGESYPGTR
eukprot:3101421-Rhodomonas_salina.2